MSRFPRPPKTSLPASSPAAIVRPKTRMAVFLPRPATGRHTFRCVPVVFPPAALGPDRDLAIGIHKNWYGRRVGAEIMSRWPPSGESVARAGARRCGEGLPETRSPPIAGEGMARADGRCHRPPCSPAPPSPGRLIAPPERIPQCSSSAHAPGNLTLITGGNKMITFTHQPHTGRTDVGSNSGRAPGSVATGS